MVEHLLIIHNSPNNVTGADTSDTIELQMLQMAMQLARKYLNRYFQHL